MQPLFIDDALAPLGIFLQNQHGDNAFSIDFAQASHPEQEPVR
jgi:hypothetical protein